MNIFNSDLYRLRKSASFRNTILGLIGLIIFIGFSLKFFSNTDGLVIFIDEYSNNTIPQSSLEDIEAIQEIANAVTFTDEILGSNILSLFLLPIIITIFGADFTAGTFRNTLSYESNRRKIYIAKLLLSCLTCLVLTLIILPVSWIIGGMLFGFSGFTADYFLTAFISILLMFPIQAGVICFGHCIIAITRKSSSTIAIYLLALIFLSIILQTLSLLKPLSWLILLDWNAACKLMINYNLMKISEIITAIAFGIGISAITTALGITCYKRTDMV